MGWKDFVPDSAEDWVEDRAKDVGDAIEWTGDKVADVAEEVGLDEAGDWVRDKSRSAANQLGADVSELELGQTEDPNRLVYGSVSKIRAQVSHLNDFKSSFTLVGNGLKGLEGDGLKGASADAFREAIAKEPPRWFEAAEAFGKAADAMGRFAETVEWAQSKAKEALEDYNKARKISQDARTAYNKSITDYKAAVEAEKDTLPPRPADDFTDPGKPLIKAAQDKLDTARTQRNEVAETARTAVRAARDAAPPKPSYAEQLKDGMDYLELAQTHLAGGVVKGTAGLVNFVRSVNPMDPYNLTHPAEYLTSLNSTVAGLTVAVNDPMGAGKQMLDEFMKDPSEGVGKLLPELVGTKGLGALKKGASVARLADDIPASKPRVSLNKDGPGASDKPDVHKTSEGTDPIDLATGRMYLPQTDVELPGALPLVFTRRVDSGYRSGRWFGPSWSSTIDQRLEIDAEGVILVTEDGLLLPFPHPAPGVPVVPVSGARIPLERAPDGDYTLTDPDTGIVRRFTGPPDDSGSATAPLAQLEDRNGNVITFEYDAAGTPLGISHSAGHGLRFETADGRITALHLVGGPRVLAYGYTGGNLTEVVNSSGLPLRFAYDERDRVTSWTDTNDRRYAYAYDDRDRCIAEGGSGGHLALTLTYDDVDPGSGNRITTVTTAAGHTRRYLVDDQYRIVARTDELGALTSLTYDRYGRLLTETDPLGLSTHRTYDDGGRLLSVVRQDGRAWSAEYDELGLPVKVVNPDGTVIRQTYDERGNRTSVTGPSGATTRFTHDSRGRLSSVTDPLGRTSRIRFDAAGRVVSATEPLGATTSWQRDAFGRPASVTDALGHTTRFTWSVEGLILHRANPDGSEESWTYDGEGNCLTHRDAAGGVTVSEYGDFDLLTARTRPDGIRYAFAYDAELRLTEVTDPRGRSWNYTYDGAGRLVEENDFDSRSISYRYDAAGRLISRTDALGTTVVFERNVLGQVVRKDAAGAVTTFEYDVSDHLVAATCQDSTISWLRDRSGLVRSETVDGRTIGFGYDVLGRRTHRTTPTGARSLWTYDETGRRSALTASGRTLTFERDAVGRELTRRVGGLTLSQVYDEAGRLTGQHLVGPDGGTARRRAFSYRADGLLTGIEDSHTGSRTFALDTVGRITGVDAAGWSERYAYDETGNQSTASWPEAHPGAAARGKRVYDGTRVTRAGAMRYEYDALGRMVLRQKARPSRKPDTWHYAWDTEDRLTEVTTPDGTVWRYRYDALGRRSAKQRLGTDGETVVEQVDFVWDGTTLCEQISRTAGSPHLMVLTWEHNGLRPLTQTERILAADAPQEAVDERFFSMVTDMVGTPTELVDESGALAWQSRSTVWGATAWPAASTAATPLRFPGQYHDPESGLHYNVHRHYDPETARYASPDPLGLKAAPNPVAYVVNPYRELDPLGLTPYKVLYHGTQEWKGTHFSLDPDVNVKREYTPDAGVYLTDDFQRAAQQYAGPGGTVVRVEVPADFAQSVYRLHSGPGGNLPEYFVNTPEGIELLNKHLRALPQAKAFVENVMGTF
ncbi:putative T7SS-secreted protein [Streptomyces sp. NPDC001502]|uniref:putative T7SS-secreted protein n=1 Tax=Streptomyces sp. NPDC001502 TaxID=3364578 RepID=UPI00368FEEE6